MKLFVPLFLLGLALLPTNSWAITLINPLGNTSLVGFVLLLLNAILILAEIVIFVALFMAGFKYVVEKDPSKIAENNKNIVYLLIGAVIILSAHALYRLISDIVLDLTV